MLWMWQSLDVNHREAATSCSAKCTLAVVMLVKRATEKGISGRRCGSFDRQSSMLTDGRTLTQPSVAETFQPAIGWRSEETSLRA